jgi:hypothetical protein
MKAISRNLKQAEVPTAIRIRVAGIHPRAFDDGWNSDSWWTESAHRWAPMQSPRSYLS